MTHADVRMYRLGTGDCFVIKFFKGQEEKFKMMIDAGVWQSTKSKLTPYIENLKEYVDNHLHLLVITHEHQDHVLAFERCKDLFTNDFKVDQIWMGWTEKDGDPEVENWKQEYGQKKMALAFAAKELEDAVESPAFQQQFAGAPEAEKIIALREDFSEALTEFAKLHVDVRLTESARFGLYKGGLRGMKVVKEQIADNNIQYFSPGDIVENMENAEGIKFYVLGPPALYEFVKKEHGGAGETYDHNKELSESSAFAEAVLAFDREGGDTSPNRKMLPFDRIYAMGKDSQKAQVVESYHEKQNDWRRIDFDWLFSAGSLALRMNSLTNNLSLALAIEFEDSGRVMLFPGDAEFGSWASWHTIDWKEPARQEGKHLTEDLLNRTVFYKVAHHLSHNGTARRLGLEMMNHPDLAAMATLDYQVISKGWKNTMPNRAIIEELLKRSKGRLIIMNEEDLEHGSRSMSDKITDARTKMTNTERAAFEEAFENHDFYMQYRVKGG